MARKSMNEVGDLGTAGERLEEGKHKVTITKLENKTASTGTEMVNITFENDEGVAWDRLILTEKALGFTKRILSACNYDIDSLEYEEDDGYVTAFFMDGDEYTLEELLLDEEVVITLKKGDSSYKDPATGETIVRDKDIFEVTNIESVDEAEED